MSKPGISTPLKRAQKGKPPTVEWAKWVEDEIRKLQSTRTPPLRQIASASDKDPFWATISRVPQSDPATYQVTVTLGYLSYQSNTPAAQASDLGVTGWVVPKIGGVSMESEEVEPLELPAVESWVYLRVKTDVDGFPKEGEVTVEAFDEAQESVHHHRLNPLSAEQEGDYFFLLLKTEADESTPPKPIAERRITGNREMPNQLIENLNVGDKREWYKGYLVEDDRHEWRTAEQIGARGEPVILPLEEGEDEGDTLKWKTVAERASQPQVKVSTKEDGEVIVVEGNGYDAADSAVRHFSISVIDGLVTSFLKEEDGGRNLNLTINAKDYNSLGTINQPNEEPYPVAVLYWRDGIYVGSADPGDAPVPLDEYTVTLLQMGA